MSICFTGVYMSKCYMGQGFILWLDLTNRYSGCDDWLQCYCSVRQSITCYHTNHIPPTWYAQLEKWKGNYIEHLRIIQLCEANLNFTLHVLWGKRMSIRFTGVYVSKCHMGQGFILWLDLTNRYSGCDDWLRCYCSVWQSITCYHTNHIPLTWYAYFIMQIHL